MNSLRSLRILLQLILLWIGLELGNCVDFNRATTGVAYSAFVQRLENGAIPAWSTTTLKNIKTMLEVISTKFTMIATYGVGAKNVEYIPNSTYYDGKQGLTGEAAALINRDRKNKSITILVGLWLSPEPLQMGTEMEVALESAQIANTIYPGTVVGLVASHNEIGDKTKLERTQQALDVVTQLKDRAHAIGLKVGTRQKCYEKSGEPGKLLRQIANTSDFIICEMEPARDHIASGGIAGFETVGDDLLALRNFLGIINPNLEVQGQSGWASKGKDPWRTIENMKLYWETANAWASKNNYTMWMLEAMDNPWKNWDAESAYLGWWKLRRNADLDKLEGYAEKILEPPEVEEEPSTEATNPWVYVGVALGVLVLLFIMALFAMLFLRVKKLQDALTTDDVNEFMNGVGENSPQAQSGQMENALKFPYDKSYEIPKDKLKIKRDMLLGTGQFGCVYKAEIENEENTEVALKMAKSDCPKSALKSLLSEIKILTYLGKHPNIVCILGAYTSELTNGIVYVATELCKLGSLEDYLRDNQTNKTADRYANAPVLKAAVETDVDRADITLGDMIRWSHEIACGMEYLGTKHVVHADLSSRNVLLASDKTAKITDFGLSRRLYDYTNYVKKQQEPLPWRWMAIESLKRLEFSSKSDVWSYGVTLWEIFSMGDLPYPGLSWNLDFVDNLVDGLRMKRPPHATPEVYKVMVDCWHKVPNERPTFTDLKLSTGHLFENAARGGNNYVENTYYSNQPPPAYSVSA